MRAIRMYEIDGLQGKDISRPALPGVRFFIDSSVGCNEHNDGLSMLARTS
uniref:Uncharacterized protein n=1 Tax=Thermosporothrix sp. COM3 TaxID=2490863 RepID=A0A455SQB9_9CHLR|nr:hypothetical protein KTC_20850 [Thermosporothrix sp. COM3]